MGTVIVTEMAQPFYWSLQRSKLANCSVNEREENLSFLGWTYSESI